MPGAPCSRKTTGTLHAYTKVYKTHTFTLCIQSRKVTRVREKVTRFRGIPGIIYILRRIIYISIPFTIFALLFSLPPSRNSDPESNSRLFSPPTHYGSCLAFFSREDFSSFFPRRLASNCAYHTLGAVSSLSISYLCK